MNPRNTVFDAKRLIGRKFSEPAVQEDMRHFSFTVKVSSWAVGDGIGTTEKDGGTAFSISGARARWRLSELHGLDMVATGPGSEWAARGSGNQRFLEVEGMLTSPQRGQGPVSAWMLLKQGLNGLC